MKKINDVQMIQFELMKRASFNNFNGEEVMKDLMDNSELWYGCIMTRLNELIQLRDIKDNDWNVDTLYILTSGINDSILERFAEKWGADECVYLSGEKASFLLGEHPAQNKVLSIWWD